MFILSLTAVQRLGNQAWNCKMCYSEQSKVEALKVETCGCSQGENKSPCSSSIEIGNIIEYWKKCIELAPTLFSFRSHLQLYQLQLYELFEKRKKKRGHEPKYLSIFLATELVRKHVCLGIKFLGANVSMHQTNSSKSPKIYFHSYFHIL